MADTNLLIVTLLGIGVVISVLMVGIGGFARGGDWNRRNGNRMMRWRIYAQAGAILAMMALAFWGAR